MPLLSPHTHTRLGTRTLASGQGRHTHLPRTPPAPYPTQVSSNLRPTPSRRLKPCETPFGMPSRAALRPLADTPCCAGLAWAHTRYNLYKATVADAPCLVQYGGSLPHSFPEPRTGTHARTPSHKHRCQALLNANGNALVNLAVGSVKVGDVLCAALQRGGAAHMSRLHAEALSRGLPSVRSVEGALGQGRKQPPSRCCSPSRLCAAPHFGTAPSPPHPPSQIYATGQYVVECRALLSIG